MLLAHSFLSEKARGMVTGRNASSGTVATAPTGSPVFMNIRMACAGSTAIKGSATTPASEAVTKTSPMVKTDPSVIERHTLAYGVGTEHTRPVRDTHGVRGR